MTKQEIIQQTNAFFSERMDFDMSHVTPETELKRDMGMTSLDAINTAIFVKHTFGITPQESDIKAIITLQDLYDFIEANQAV